MADSITPHSNERFPVIGLGASAGGLHALQTFLDHLPSDTGMAFVVLLHLAPDVESTAALLQPHTAMPVTQVKQTVALQPNQVYVIPPAYHLQVVDDVIRLEDPSTERDRRAPIDHFFRKLADAHASHASAVILSGMGSDGAVGLARIKEQGGTIFVQDPHEAEFDGMPRNAIATGLADFVLPVAALPEVIAAYWRRAALLPTAAGDVAENNDEEASLREVLALLRVRTNHNFNAYKRPTLLRRIGRRMQVTGVTDYAGYLDVLRSRAEEVQALLKDLLISVTNFFRDPASWSALEAIVPQLFAGKGPDDQVRVWVAACATGEEAYSVAMLLDEYARTLDAAPLMQVFATDIDDDALRRAREGRYLETIAADVSPERLRRYFVFEQGRYRVKQELRERVLFAHHNLLRDPPFSRLDLITCRNLLIYLQRDAQEQVVSLVHFSLRPGGYLLLGSAETLDGLPQLFDVVAKSQRLFRQRDEPFVGPLPLHGRGVTRPAGLVAAGPEHAARAAPSAGALATLHQRLLLQHAPASMIVNADHQIVHLSRGANRFLQQEGAPSTNLVQAAHPDLRLTLRSLLFQAFEHGGRAKRSHLRVAIDDAPRLVDLSIEPIQDAEWPNGHLLVLISDAGAAHKSGSAAPAGDKAIRELEAELERTRQQLQLTIEEYETTGEEFKASNEELQSINEELRAAGEELETSKEEMQAVNEELSTVNEELKNRVDEVSRANNDLQNLISATAIATLFVDRELRLTRYTPSAEEIFNLIPTDLHRPLAHITHSLEDDQLMADAAQVLHSLQPIEREVVATDKRWFLVQLRPYRTTDDRIAGVVLTLLDITVRKQAEAEVARALAAEQRARAEAEAALKTRDQFLSIASHELRTPLTSLIGYSYLLPHVATQGAEAVVTLSERISHQAQRLNSLITQLLDVSRLEQGRFALERQRLDLSALATQVVDAFAVSLQAGDAHPIEVQGVDEPLEISADGPRLEQVLLNLLSNAVKYSPRGRPITVRLTGGGGRAVLEIIDQGIGIPEEAQQRLFEPFFRAANVPSQSSGFGIGMYIVQQIVERHGGYLEVASADGQGTTVRVVLPLDGEGNAVVPPDASYGAADLLRRERPADDTRSSK